MVRLLTIRLRMDMSDRIRERGIYSCITPPFHCDDGGNIRLGSGCYFNKDCYLGDRARIDIGDRVLLGPRVRLQTQHQATDQAEPICIKDDCWLCAGGHRRPGGSHRAWLRHRGGLRHHPRCRPALPHARQPRAARQNAPPKRRLMQADTSGEQSAGSANRRRRASNIARRSGSAQGAASGTDTGGSALLDEPPGKWRCSKLRA